MSSKKKNTVQFAVCIRNEGADDLELCKVYQILPDESAARSDYVRVIDEAGEDYVYPASYFVMIEVAPEAQAVLIAASGK